MKISDDTVDFRLQVVRIKVFFYDDQLEKYVQVETEQDMQQGQITKDIKEYSKTAEARIKRIYGKLLISSTFIEDNYKVLVYPSDPSNPLPVVVLTDKKTVHLRLLNIKNETIADTVINANILQKILQKKVTWKEIPKEIEYFEWQKIAKKEFNKKNITSVLNISHDTVDFRLQDWRDIRATVYNSMENNTHRDYLPGKKTDDPILNVLTTVGNERSFKTDRDRSEILLQVGNEDKTITLPSGIEADNVLKDTYKQRQLLKEHFPKEHFPALHDGSSIWTKAYKSDAGQRIVRYLPKKERTLPSEGSFKGWHRHN